jgi:hypothetical protein
MFDVHKCISRTAYSTVLDNALSLASRCAFSRSYLRLA